MRDKTPHFLLKSAAYDISASKTPLTPYVIYTLNPYKNNDGKAKD
jgi:hypothetical protein